MRPKAFDYFSPSTLEEAVSLLGEHASDARILAGGQSLLPIMKLRLAAPAILIDITRVSELDYVRGNGNGTIAIGALATHDTLEHEAMLRMRCPVVAETASHIADLQVRNRGTMGGNCCHAAPESDYPPLLLALDADFEVRGSSGARVVPASDFFTGLFSTALAAEELLTEIRFPAISGRVGGAHLKLARRYNDYGIVSVVALVKLDADRNAEDVRVAVGHAAPTPVRARSVEAALRGQHLTNELIRQAASEVTADIDPSPDLHASSNYRKKVAAVLVERAVNLAQERAKEAE